MLARTHHAGTLRSEQAGEAVTLCGWVASRRDHGGLIFLELRDRSGIVQVTFNQARDAALFAEAEPLRLEYCIGVAGTVAARSEQNVNPEMPTGALEVLATQLEIFGRVEGNLPFPIHEKRTATSVSGSRSGPKSASVSGSRSGPKSASVSGSRSGPKSASVSRSRSARDDPGEASEETRLAYRFLDLRRPAMQEHFRIRHAVTRAIRQYLDARDYWEIETPVLTRSTPEGARDYLVPSRRYPGQFFALPQSPQVFKQLFQVAGFERYYQIVKCFRDEDLRGDRQPEFTQLDLEASFIEQEDILTLMEGLMAHVWKDVLGVEVPLPFPRLSYDEALNRTGRDAPDLRYAMELVDVGAIVEGAGFKVFSGALAAGGTVRGLAVKGGAELSRKQIDALQTLVKEHHGAKGLAWCKLAASESGAVLEGGIAKFVASVAVPLIEAFDAEPGDLLLFLADAAEVVLPGLGALRARLAQERGLIPADTYQFCWVLDFPMFAYDADAERYTAVHHPFTLPHAGDLQYLESEPARVRAVAHDLVLNGVELGGGSMRIHAKQIQERVFAAIGIDGEEAEARFGHLLRALSFGAPPHGGIALGLDRWVMLMCGLDNIREVIAFPKSASSQCPLTGAPAEVDAAQLADLGLTLIRVPDAR